MITKQRIFIDDELAIVVKVNHSSGNKDFSATAWYRHYAEEEVGYNTITDKETVEHNGWTVAVRSAVESATANLRELDKKYTMETQVQDNLESVVREALENQLIPERFKHDK